MNVLRIARTLTASFGVLAVGAMLAGPAMAFDVVDWNWYKTKYQNETINVNIDVDIESTGLVEIEKLQIFFGNSTAYADTSWVINDQHDAGGYWRDTYSCYCYGKVWVPTPLDAPANLPEVKTAASAFGNLQVISTDVPVFLHDGQFVANDGGEGYELGYSAFSNLLDYAGYGSGNFHTDLAKAFTLGVVYNILDPAYITATANTSHIVNATVDNSATAAANLIQVNLESDVDGTDTPAAGEVRLSNHVVQADITQFAYADVSATANVHGVYVSNYSNLGLIDRPLVSNIATSIGNGVIVNVGPVPVP